MLGESAGVGDEVLYAFAWNYLVGHGAAHRTLNLRAGADGLDHQVVAVLGVDQSRAARLGQVAVEVEGLYRFASAHHAHTAHGTGFGGSACGRDEVEGAVGGGKRVGSGLLDLTGYVDRDAAGKVQSEVHLVACQVKVGGEALGDGVFGLGKGHSGHVEAPESREFDESACVDLEGLADQGGSVDRDGEFVSGPDEVAGRSLYDLVALGVGLEVGALEKVHAKDVAAVVDYFGLRHAGSRSLDCELRAGLLSH